MTDVEKVKKFVEKANSTTVEEISDITGISIQDINQMIFSGEVVIPSELERRNMRKCEKCGDYIYTGRYCERCIREISGQLRAAFMADRRRVPTEDVGRMHFFR